MLNYLQPGGLWSLVVLFNRQVSYIVACCSSSCALASHISCYPPTFPHILSDSMTYIFSFVHICMLFKNSAQSEEILIAQSRLWEKFQIFGLRRNLNFPCSAFSFRTSTWLCFHSTKLCKHALHLILLLGHPRHPRPPDPQRQRTKGPPVLALHKNPPEEAGQAVGRLVISLQTPAFPLWVAFNLQKNPLLLLRHIRNR
jgi:hypothetical protein